MINVELLKSISLFKTFKSNAVVVNAGSGGDQMYIVVKGNAIVYENYRKPNQHIIGELNPGDFFGEMTLFLNKPSAATVVSLSDLTLLEVTRNNVYQFFQNEPEAAYLITQNVCQRFDNLNAQVQAGTINTGRKTTDKRGKKPEKPSTALFPSGHEHYVLPASQEKEGLFLDGTMTCPICGNTFDFPHVRTVLLRTAHTDYDLRKTHDGINMTHYLTVTCPKCLFSALTEKFNDASKIKETRVHEITAPLKNELAKISFENLDADTIFARLYLSLKFTRLCFDNSEMLDGRLWMNISWLYRDCGDTEMENYAMQQALQTYNHVYQNANMGKKTEQSVCQILGELHYKLENKEEAKKFFFIAKTTRGGDAIVENLADDRLTELKKQEKQEKQGE